MRENVDKNNSKYGHFSRSVDVFVFLWMSLIEILKNLKNTHLATNFSKGDIFC